MWRPRRQWPPHPPLRLFPQGAAASLALQWCPLPPPSLGSMSFLKCAEAFPRPPPLWEKTVGLAGQSRAWAWARARAAHTPTPSPIFPRTPHQKLWLDKQHPQSLASKTVGSSALGLRLRWGGAWMPSEAKTAWAQGAAPPESDRWATPMPQHQDSLTRRTPSFLHL